MLTATAPAQTILSNGKRDGSHNDLDTWRIPRIAPDSYLCHRFFEKS